MILANEQSADTPTPSNSLGNQRKQAVNGTQGVRHDCACSGERESVILQSGPGESEIEPREKAERHAQQARICAFVHFLQAIWRQLQLHVNQCVSDCAKVGKTIADALHQRQSTGKNPRI